MVNRNNDKGTNRETKYSLLIASCCLLFISIFIIILWKISKIGFGGDFNQFYAASLMAAHGNIVDIYNPQLIQSMTLKATGIDLPYYWLYPPTYLIFLLPFSQFPYLLSLSLWIFILLTCYFLTVYHIAPKSITLFITLAFPATFINILAGQNGFISASLLGMGLCLLETRPFLGGILLGIISYKPQLFILIPLALIAGGQWRALMGAASSVMGLALISVLAFGLSPWKEFYRTIPSALAILRNAQGNLPKMLGVFPSTLLMGGGPTLGWLLQGLIMIAAVAAVTWVWREGLPYLRNSLLVVSILLFTPYGFYYDLTLLALPLAWIGWEGYTQGWLPGEQMALCLGWLLPSLLICYMLGIILPIAPLILLTLFIFILIRHWTGKQRGDSYQRI
jgi:Glycosyltransferase family 87